MDENEPTEADQILQQHNMGLEMALAMQATSILILGQALVNVGRQAPGFWEALIGLSVEIAELEIKAGIKAEADYSMGPEQTEYKLGPEQAEEG